jgi:hypothetical protein
MSQFSTRRSTEKKPGSYTRDERGNPYLHCFKRSASATSENFTKIPFKPEIREKDPWTPAELRKPHTIEKKPWAAKHNVPFSANVGMLKSLKPPRCRSIEEYEGLPAEDRAKIGGPKLSDVL